MTAAEAPGYADRLRQVLRSREERVSGERLHVVTPSTLGWCQQKVVLMVRGVQPTDPKEHFGAQWGRAIHHEIAEANREFGNPNGLVEHRVTTMITVPGYGDAELHGQVDWIDPDEPSVDDYKTSEDVAMYRRNGPSRSQRWQVQTYALGAVQNGLVSEDGLTVRIVHIDRDGDPDFVVHEEPFNRAVFEEIGAWLSDVFYAVHHDTDAEREVPAPICERVCEFFTVCRGDLPMDETFGLVTDPELVDAADAYLEGKRQVEHGEALMEGARHLLRGVNGRTARHTIRWVHVNETEGRSAYDRLDVRKTRRF